ncbi:50S ribosomal protein L24 [Algoriphagus sp. NF]|jgi:large subunit ribosomal protein L24|uniref:Large ribosomal subunit protein uL24 n=3 Tax=Algoriphagus TaxID=246875 RepID=A0ABS7N7G6_9BACT|nr:MULTISPECIES: 50S ribosomal protein L24 [Algoriphagus]KPQ16849.1 MAG: LSU ribosomal protein L24 RplX [Algoriphagus marincola HL-49]MCR9081979.1 50S ribosomal protein L24 [Cyclobacteriaceae bacterium]MBY5952279.1 50S ribosomal protein L24 [Algoriphagus marincola]MDE0559878.1 50S ribosomal protein L24 [Algoriphagus sp. NF]TDK44710.1 50S ribosomal protein L24 [Algoriphagus aquimaris]
MASKINKQTKLHVKTGDTVKVIAGDDKGKTGKILAIDTQKQRAFVEGINMVTKHVKPTAAKPQGGIEKKEASVHISNLMLVDPKSGEATRIGRKMGDNGKLVRYAKKTGEVING